jgi:CARDB
VAFLDEEPQLAAPQEPERPPRRPGGPERKRQQFLARRLIAVGLGVALLILFVIGVRGCLEARSDRGLRNYSQDIGTIMAESEQRGKDFFEAIESSGSDIDLESTVSSLRGASETLLDRAENLDVPDQMRDAQTATTLSLRLRRDGLGTIAENVTEAGADAETAEAIESITNSMGEFYASDILWSQEARPEIEQVIQEEGVEGGIDLGAETFGTFMPENSGTEFLDQTEVAEIFSGVTGGEATGLQGLGLTQTSLGDTTLDPDITNEVADDASEVAVQVQNQGESEATNIGVQVTIEGTELETTIEKLAPGESGTAKVTINPLPQPGSEVTLEVFVAPVAGEADSSNNESSYTVIFGSP